MRPGAPSGSTAATGTANAPRVAPSNLNFPSMHAKQAEQLYSLQDVSRILKVPTDRLRALQERREMLGPDVIIPGGGHKAARWSATRVTMIQRNWAMPMSA